MPRCIVELWWHMDAGLWLYNDFCGGGANGLPGLIHLKIIIEKELPDSEEENKCECYSQSMDCPKPSLGLPITRHASLVPSADCLWRKTAYRTLPHQPIAHLRTVSRNGRYSSWIEDWPKGRMDRLRQGWPTWWRLTALQESLRVSVWRDDSYERF